MTSISLHQRRVPSYRDRTAFTFGGTVFKATLVLGIALFIGFLADGVSSFAFALMAALCFIAFVMVGWVAPSKSTGVLAGAAAGLAAGAMALILCFVNDIYPPMVELSLLPSAAFLAVFGIVSSAVGHMARKHWQARS